MKICITCSAGGHLVESLQIASTIKTHEIFYFTFFVEHLRETLRKYKTYFTINPRRNPIKFLKVIYDSFKVLMGEKPKVIISTGAGVTIPICILGKLLFRTKVVYVDCSAQAYKPSYTGKIVYWFADLFFVQWKHMVKRYGEKAMYGGLLI